MPLSGQGTRRTPEWPGGRSPRPIRWAAGARCRFRPTGAAAQSPRGAPDIVGRNSATCSATCRNPTTNWRRSRPRPGPRSARQPRAHQAGPPGRAGGGTGGSMMSPSLWRACARASRPRRGRVPRPLQSRERVLRSRCACLRASRPAVRPSGRLFHAAPAHPHHPRASRRPAPSRRPPGRRSQRRHPRHHQRLRRPPRPLPSRPRRRSRPADHHRVDPPGQGRTHRSTRPRRQPDPPPGQPPAHRRRHPSPHHQPRRPEWRHPRRRPRREGSHLPAARAQGHLPARTRQTPG
jgi:hypothetical protein